MSTSGLLPRYLPRLIIVALLLVSGLSGGASPVRADNTVQSLPFSQSWTNIGLITTNDDWSGVPGIVGFLGQDITTSTGVDPQTLLGVSALVNDADVIANQTNTTLATGGVAEFHLTDPTIALNGSGTADAPHIILYLNTVGQSSITVAYNLRDLDGSVDNAVQPVALQYRVGSSGNFTNVPAGFVADATTGPSLATLVTPINVVLPAAVDNQPEVQVRIITANAVGNDEWVGVDDINVTGTPIVVDTAPFVISTAPVNGAVNVALGANLGVNFNEAVTVSGTWFDITCATSGTHTAIVSGGPQDYVLDPDADFVNSESCTATVFAAQVADQDANDPPDTMVTDYSWSFTTESPPPPPGDVVVSQVYGGGGNTGATLKNDFIELYNQGTTTVSLSGWSVQYASATGTGAWSVTALSGSIPPQHYYLVQEAAGAGGTVSLPTPDAIGTIAMSATAGKVALVNNTTALSGACPTSSNIFDRVGYGSTANCFEGSAAAPGLSNTTAAIRAGEGCVDTDDNSADFTAGTPNPQNTSVFHSCTDNAPHIATSTPSNGALGVALNTNLTLNFDEPVDVTGSWFAIACATSGAHNATVSGGPQTFTLDPDSDFVSNETCSVTITASQVTDQDTDDPPDAMTANYVLNFTTLEVLVCGDPATAIHTIQGSGLTSPLNGTPNTVIEGVVVGDYQNTTTELSGFYVQEEDAESDADSLTSEGLFVFDNGFGTDVTVGDVVRVKGTVTEFFNLTELGSVSVVQVCSSGNSVTPASVSLPVNALSDWEPFEGMLINIAQDLTVTEHFTLGRFGEVSLSINGRLPNPTNIVLPGAPAIAQADLNDRSRIMLDDGNSQQNIDPTHYPTGGLSFTNTLRTGDTVNGLTGVLDERFSAYRVQPVGPITFVASNPRPTTPDTVGGALKVSAFNVLNYFNGNGLGGGFPTPRGAENQFEFDRQRAKIINAIVALDADIIGLMEMENDALGNSAIEDLVSGLNAATAPGTYAFINTGVVGTDEIRVALLYKPATVTPVGVYAILDSSVDPRFIDTKNRPSLAQTFQLNANGAALTVVVNHLKSKGSACDDVGDPDTGDGQGNCNGTRTEAAEALVDWLATDPTSSGDADFLIIGDMNAYAKEDPITAIRNAGYTNLIDAYLGAEAYSFVFDGESGYLDHALSSPSLTAQITGVTEWHTNADEPTVLDYNTNFKTANQIITFYDPAPYRASDHDPVLVGIGLNDPPTVDAGGPYDVDEDGSVLVMASGNDPNTGETLTYAWDLDNNGSFETAGQSATFSAVGLDGPATRTITVQVTDSGGLTATAQALVTIHNVTPTIVVAPGGVCASSGGTLNLTIGDASGDTLSLSGVSSNTSAVPNANIVLGGSGTNRTVTVTAVPASTIRYATLTLTVSDGTASASVTIQVIVGTSGNNPALTGTSDADLVLGLSGNDTLSGLAGHDLLCGGSGNDTLTGGDNNDTLDGDSGNDVLNGDSGDDLLRGASGNDALNGGTGHDVLDGGTGNDVLNGGDDNDNLLGGSGNDTLTGGGNADFFSGGTGSDAATDFNAGEGDTQDGTIP